MGLYMSMCICICIHVSVLMCWDFIRGSGLGMERPLEHGVQKRGVLHRLLLSQRPTLPSSRFLAGLLRSTMTNPTVVDRNPA